MQDAQGASAGAVWTPHQPHAFWISITSSADGSKLAASGHLGVWTSTDSGVTWTARTGDSNSYGITSSADGSKLAFLQYGGRIFTSTDSGVTWTARESNRDWFSITSSADGTKLAAVVKDGRIYTSTDSGVTWTARESNRSWHSIASSEDGSKLAAVVFGGQIYTSTDSGVTWSARESNRTWLSITSSADGSKLAAVSGSYGGVGYIYTSTDSGVTWTPRDSARSWICITSSVDGSKLVAVVDGGQIYTSTDSGETWTARDSNRNWRSIASSADGSKLAAAVLNGLIYTSDTVLRVTPSTADLAINATTLTITGTNFDADIPGNNTVVFTPSGTGTVTAATASSLTVTGITGLTLGALSAVVTTNGENSGSPVQVATIFPPPAPGGEVQLDASALALMDGATVTSWGGQTASDTPTYQANRSPNGLPAVVFNSTDRMGDNVSVPTRSAQDWIYVAVIKPVKTGAYHNLSEDDPGGRPMLWIDNSNRYEFNLGGTTRPAIGTGPGGWDIVIADSRLNKLYVNSGTISVDGGGAVAYGTAKNFDFFHRDNTATFQGEVAEVRVYNDRAAFGGDISLLYNELHAKWFAGAAAPTVTSVSPDSGSALGGTSVTITGANFNATTGVTFGGTPATTVNVVNSTTITAVTPGSIAGQVSVLVTTTGGTNAANTLFNYTVVPNTAPSFTLPAGTGGPPGFDWTARAGNRRWYSVTSSADGSKLAAVAWQGQIHTSTDSGVTWTARESNRLWYSITSSADGSKLAAVVENGGLIYTSTDSGVTWTPRGVNRRWYSITSSADGTKLAAVVNGSWIYTSADSGVTWTAQNSALQSWISITSSADGSKLAAVAFGGPIYTSTDSGATWTEQSAAGSRNWQAITSSADGSKLAAVVSGGQIYTSTDSGVTWTARDSNRAWQAIASSADGSKLTAGVFGGQIYTSTNSGVTWTARDSNRSWQAIASSADGSKLVAGVAGTGGQIYTSVDTTVPYNLNVGAGSGPQTMPAFATAISSGPVADTGQTVNFTLSNDNNSLFNAQPAIASNGTLTFTPGTTLGVATVTVTAVDNGGIANGGADTSAVQTFTITVNPPGDEITPVTINAVSSELAASFDRGAIRAVDSSGLSGELHTNVANANMWLTHGTFQAPNDPLPAEITFDLGGAYDVNWLHVWNYNEAGAANRGAKDVTVSVASSPGGAFTPVGNLVFPIATGLTGYPGSRVNFTATNVRQVRLQITTNHGDTQSFAGLSEIKFFGVPSTPQPTVTNVTPATGSTAGGTSVTITGTNFTGATGVTIGGTAATSVSVVNDTTITAVTPAGAAGTASVLVTTPGGTNAANSLFTYLVLNTAPSFTLPAGVITPVGVAWTARDSNRTWRSITSSADGSKLAAVEENGQIYTSTDSGVTWTARDSNRLWRSITSSADGSKLAAVVHNGPIYTSTDSGVTWTPQASGNRTWNSITSSVDGSKLAAVVHNGQIYTSTDSGVTWTARESNRVWFSITSSADGSKLTAAGFGGIFTSTDSGETWTARDSGRLWTSITSSADGSKLAALVSNGQIYTSTDSGETWTPRDSDRFWRSITSSADGSKLAAVVDGGQIYTSTDSGVTWTPQASGNRFWSSITSSADGSKLAAAVVYGQIYTSVASSVPYNLTVATGSGLQTTPTFATAISPGPVADAGQTVSFTVSNDNNSLFTSQPTIASNGTLTFTPGTTPGVATVSVIAVDDGGTANGGADTSAVQTFTITVNPPGDEITPVTINAVSSELAASFDRGAIRAVDNSGLSGGLHTHVADANMWLTHGNFQSPHDLLPAQITFDLGAVYDVNWLHVWNYNEAGAANRGAKDVTVSVASTPGGAFTPVGNLVFPIATGLTDYPGARVDFTATNVRQVRFEITTNHGNAQSFAGLSEIKFFGVPSIAPSVTNVTPSTGSSSGGTSVTITGTNFTGATSVTFNGAAATSVTVVNATTITAVTPAGTVGGASVLVSTPGGTNAANTLFSYTPPPNLPPSFTLPAGTITQAGETWIAGAEIDVVALTSSADGSKLAAMGTGSIYTSTDSGVSWLPRVSISGRSITSSSDGTKLAAVAPSNPVLISTDSGVTWSNVGNSRNWYSITSSADGSRLAAVAIDAPIQISSNGGASWTSRETSRKWRSITSSADGIKLAAVASTLGSVVMPEDQLLTSSDGGVTWTVRETPRSWWCITSSADGSTLAAAVRNGHIYISNDSGVSWTQRASVQNWTGITSSADGTRLAATSYSGAIHTSGDGGVTWTERAGSRGWMSITSSSDGSKLVAAAQGTRIYTSSGTFIPYNVTVTAASGTYTPGFFATNISPGPVNESAQAVSFQVSNDNNALFAVQPSLASNGTLTFAPGMTVGTATVTVVAVDNGGTANGGVDTSAPQTFTITVTPSTRPTVTHITPASGSTAGGTSVTITGTNFTGVTAVTFDEVNAMSYTVDSPTQITAVTPALGNVGGAQVQVATSSGISTNMTLFNYIYNVESWRLEYFGNATGTGNRADTADFDSDGKNNLLEFAFGTDPTVSSTGELTMTGTYAAATFGTTGQPMIKLEPSANGVDFRLLFIRRADHAAVGLSYIPEFSAGFNPWTPSATIPTVLATSGDFQLVSVPYPHFLPNGKKARFSQVRVTITP